MSILSKIYILISLSLALSFAGCSDDAIRSDLPGDDEEQMAGNFFIHLRMNLCDNGIPGSRADGDTPDSGSGTGGETPGSGTDDDKHLFPGTGEDSGTDREREIKTLDLLVYDVSEADKDLLIDIICLSEKQITAINSASGLTVPIFAKEGMTVSIYAVANMPEKMRSQFIINQTKGRNNILATSTGANYWDVINEFVPESNGRQDDFEKAKGKGIPMTGQFIIKYEAGATSLDGTDNAEGHGNFKITDKHKTKDTPLPITAELTRIVAKIHVLAKALPPRDLTDGTEDVYYVYALDNKAKVAEGTTENTNDEFSNWIGWIRLRNVRYIPNGTSKSTYLFQQKNAAGNLSAWKDYKMDLESYLLARDNLDLGFDKRIWSNDFVYYNGLDLHKVNIDKDDENNEIKHVENAELYEPAKLENTLKGSNDYIKGMYCLENYFDEPETEEYQTKFSSYDDAIPMVTHVSIAARLIPRHLVITANYKDAMNKFVAEYESNKGTFYRKYGLTADDFNDTDIARWKGTIEIEKTDKDGNGTKETLEGISVRYKDYFEKDYYIYRTQFRIIKTSLETDAMYILKWSMQVNDLWDSDPAKFETGKYSACTFFVYNLDFETADDASADHVSWDQTYLYLTAGAVNIATKSDGTNGVTFDNSRIKTYSVPHLGGWGYYYTYLDDPAGGVVNPETGRTPYTSSQVTRNKYYILTISNFSSPGGTITRPEYIKVNTHEVGWDYTGKGDVNLH